MGYPHYGGYPPWGVSPPWGGYTSWGRHVTIRTPGTVWGACCTTHSATPVAKLAAAAAGDVIAGPCLFDNHAAVRASHPFLLRDDAV